MKDRLERLPSAIHHVLKQKQQQEIQHSLKESNTLTQIGRALSETERVGTDKVLQLIVTSARELICRILEGHKAYRVFHAKDGWEGLSMARHKLPDLIVSDLTMPGIDGFGLVEELKLDPRTKDIPVVVVSAKDITTEERNRLKGHIQALYQKGSLSTKKFVDKVLNVIEESDEAQDTEKMA